MKCFVCIFFMFERLLISLAQCFFSLTSHHPRHCLGVKVVSMYFSLAASALTVQTVCEIACLQTY